MKMKIYFGKKSFEVEVKRTGLAGKIRGLMFRGRRTENLLFENCEGISLHSWFVFFDFLVLWLDEKNRVLDARIVGPFEFYVKSDKKFQSIVEIPINLKNKKIVEFFVEKRKI